MGRVVEYPEGWPWQLRPRNSVDAERHVKALLARPKSPLTTAQKKQAFEFATALNKGQAAGEKVTSEYTFEQACNLSGASEFTFYLGYFDTPIGHKDITALGGEPGEDAQKIFLASKNVDPEVLQLIALHSKQWYRSQLAKMLARSAEQDGQFEPFASFTLHTAPEDLLNKSAALHAYHQFFMRVQNAPSLTPVQTFLIQLHIDRLRTILARLYPHLVTLHTQLMLDDTPQNNALLDRLCADAPLVADMIKNDHVDDFMRQLDLVRNGTGPYSSPFSGEVLQLLDCPEPKQINKSADRIDPAVVRKLQNTYWNAHECKVFLESILRDWGLLSAHQNTWQEAAERPGPAADNLCQVVIRPIKDNVAVNANKRVIFVHSTFMRPLIDTHPPAGGLPVAAHELTHLLQATLQDELAKKMPLARIKGAGFITMWEAAGVHEERALQEEYFGIQRLANVHYARALRTKLAGENKLRVIRTFYDSCVQDTQPDDAAAAKLRMHAVDRALRLYRCGGHDSQPLDYLEQEVIVAALHKFATKDIMPVLLSFGTFNLADSAKLKEFGLLNDYTAPPFVPHQDVMNKYLQPVS